MELVFHMDEYCFSEGLRHLNRKLILRDDREACVSAHSKSGRSIDSG